MTEEQMEDSYAIRWWVLNFASWVAEYSLAVVDVVDSTHCSEDLGEGWVLVVD